MKGSLSIIVSLFIVFPSRGLASESSRARVTISKPMAYDSKQSPPQPFKDISATLYQQDGFTLLADYESRIVVDGPAESASKLLEHLAASGVHAFLATDLDTVYFHDYTIDTKSGSISPEPADKAPESGNIFSVLSMSAYPRKDWVKAVQDLGFFLVSPLPSAGFVIYGDAKQLPKLAALASTRSVTPITPSMKVPTDAVMPEGNTPFQSYFVEAFEISGAESLRPTLDSLSPESVIEVRTSENHVSYEAALSPLDVSNLTLRSNVYGVSPIPRNTPSSERQAILALQPTVNGTTGDVTLPTISPNYAALLLNRGISNFSNTKIAILDTGFDNGTTTHPDFNLNGVPFVTLLTEWSTQGTYDNMSHGTITASVVAGYAPFGQRSDSGSYRYALGLAETCQLISDKFFKCDTSAVTAGSLQTALTSRIAPQNANVVNLSFNDPACGYTGDSITLDNKTRQPWLFTVSAGNVGTGGCGTVRTPATSKNALSVGATQNFTLNWANFKTDRVAECGWNDFPATQDARNMPSFSARALAGSLIKPDLVAPATRVTGPVTRQPSTPPYCNGTVMGFTYGVFCNENVDTSGGVTYAMSAGTSFAAPAVAGAAAVVRKWYRNKLGVDPSPAMTKAMLINGARDLKGAKVLRSSGTTLATIQHIYFDPYQGWGMLNLTRLLGPATTFWAHDQATVLNDFVLYQGPGLSVVDGSKDTRVTLVWSDAHGTTGSTYKVVNDLFLQVDSLFNCPCWYGNVFDASSGTSIKDPVTFVEDTVNNVEQVIIPKNTLSTGSPLRVNVVARNLMADGIVPDGSLQRQDFAVFVDNAH